MGLGSSPFARHYLGNHYCFLFLRLLRCFSSPGSPSDKSEYHAFSVMGCPIRISADQSVFASPRSLSQLITSFFAYESQGILHTPLLTFLQSPTTHLLPTLLTFMILLLVLFTYCIINVATCQRTFSPVRIRTHLKQASQVAIPVDTDLKDSC